MCTHSEIVIQDVRKMKLLIFKKVYGVGYFVGTGYETKNEHQSGYWIMRKYQGETEHKC